MRRDPIPMDDETIVTIIEQEVAQSIGHWDGSLSTERSKEMDYYLGKPYGNEVEGESQVISTDVADTIEGMLPIILEIFTKSDDVVRFDPNGPEDEEQAKQQTEVANYVFYRQNNGFLVLYEWFKDALLQKNGVVKYGWEEKQERTREPYQGLTDAEYRGLMQGDGYIEIEELSHEKYDDPVAAQKIAAVRAELQAMMQNPQAAAQAQQMLAELDAQPIPQLHDVEVRVVKDASKLWIKTIPPEEFGISSRHNCVSIQDAPFCYHRTKQTISSLRAEGCPEEILSQLPLANEEDMSPEAMSRDRFTDNTYRDDRMSDDSMREVWVTECFIRLDVDGDGIAELRHIIMPGREVWINEETDHINFAALTPVIMPHRWVGRSVSELVMDIQFQKSVLWRQMFNNLYLTNNPRKAVLSSAGGIVQANLDDLLTSRPGGIMREYVPNAIRNEEVPFVAGASFPMLEYMDSVKENRTGVTRYNQGTDADSLNKTARGVQLIQAAGQQRTALIARIFAETGVKDLMRGIVYMLSRYNSKAMTVKLRNKWVQIDPREWKTQYNMTVNVGLGTGNRDVQLAHLAKVGEMQMIMMKEGRAYMVSDENIYNLNEKMAEAMGFKHPALFFSDPNAVPPEAKKPPPSPDMVRIKVEDEQAKAKLQLDAQKEQFRAETEKALEAMRQQTALTIAQLNSETQKIIAQMKIQADAQLAVFEGTQSANGQQAQAEKVKGELVLKATAQDAEAMMKAQLHEQALRHAEEKHRSELERAAQEADAKLQERVKAEEAPLTANVMPKFMGALEGLAKGMQRQAEQSDKQFAQLIAEMKKPKKVSLDKIERGPDGMTGASATVQ